MPLGRHILFLAAEGCRHILGVCFLRANPQRRKTRRSHFYGCCGNLADAFYRQQGHPNGQWSSRVPDTVQAGTHCWIFLPERKSGRPHKGVLGAPDIFEPLYRGGKEIIHFLTRNPSGSIQSHGLQATTPS